MKKFQIIIKNRETGETLVDANTKAIIGAIDEDEGTCSICFTTCNGVELAATATAAILVANEAMADLPLSFRRKIRKLSKPTKHKN